MAYHVKITPAAVLDLEEAFIWYNEQVTDLGYKFIESIDDKLTSISNAPKSGSIRYEDVRCATVKSFPYSIHYSVDDLSQTITVYRIFHVRRKPFWESK